MFEIITHEKWTEIIPGKSYSQSSLKNFFRLMPAMKNCVVADEIFSVVASILGEICEEKKCSVCCFPASENLLHTKLGVFVKKDCAKFLLPAIDLKYFANVEFSQRFGNALMKRDPWIM
jgi:hypothetical protein